MIPPPNHKILKIGLAQSIFIRPPLKIVLAIWWLDPAETLKKAKEDAFGEHEARSLMILMEYHYFMYYVCMDCFSMYLLILEQSSPFSKTTP